MTRRRGRSRRLGDKTHCRYCGAEIMWLRHVTTGKLAPIDWYPAPGGNIVVHGETYEVVAGSERAALDPTTEDPDHGMPKLRYNHHVTCTSSRGHGREAPSDKQYAEWRAPAASVDGQSRAAGERPEEEITP